MKRNVMLLLIFSAILLTGVSYRSVAETPRIGIARIWHGKTSTAKADEYTTYITDQGISKIKAIPGNLGVQLLRKKDGETTDFVVISYWDSIDAVKRFAGEDYEKAYQLPRDSEFLINPETTVQHYEVVVNHWK